MCFGRLDGRARLLYVFPTPTPSEVAGIVWWVRFIGVGEKDGRNYRNVEGREMCWSKVGRWLYIAAWDSGTACQCRS